MSTLKKPVNKPEVTTQEETPKRGDWIVDVYEGRIEFDEIIKIVDLSSAKTTPPTNWDVGPKAGDEGWFISTYGDKNFTTKSEDLVRLPQYDSGNKRAWAEKRDFKQIMAKEKSGKASSGYDKEALQLVNAESMNDISHYEFKLSRNKKKLIFQDEYTYHSIVDWDLDGYDLLKKAGLEGLTKWFETHGAREMKMKRVKRTPSMYD